MASREGATADAPPNTATETPPSPPSPTGDQQEGSECAIQTLYEGPSKCQCCINWVKELPTNLLVSVSEQPKVKQKALVARMRNNHNGEVGGSGKPLVLDSIVVRSPSLKKTLGEVFEGYSGITPSLKKVVFKAPFRPFFYRWRRFGEILERQRREDPEAAACSQLLYDVLGAELKDAADELDDNLRNGVMTFPLLWALFEPGTRVVGMVDGDESFFDVESCNNTPGSCSVTVRYVDWNGGRFGYTTRQLSLGYFEGTRRITQLTVYPARFHPSRQDAEDRAIARGLRFQALRGIHHMAYSGSIEPAGRSFGSASKPRRELVLNGSRIIVDAVGFFQVIGGWQTLDPLAAVITPHMEVKDDVHSDTTSQIPRPSSSRVSQGFKRSNPRRRTGCEEWPEAKARAKPSGLTNEQLLLCHATVRGYSLKEKEWAVFRVNGIEEVAYNDAAFPNLMLPAGYKNLILSFVEGQANNKAAFDDIVQGKGQGIVLLFTGNPGTGKTLTAEAVADKLRKPLYVLSAGELGNGGSSVQSRLEEVMGLTERWECVLLFDECDAFLQERSSNAMAHNEIVAVFLRLIEYYRGIMFMTSNRADAIDRAFQSRIHLTLQYPDLDVAAKEHIWRRFVSVSASLSASGDSTLTGESFQRLARLSMNGREIKNVVKVATLLAAQEKTALGMDQIRTVLQATRGVGVELDA